jgi:hypothetical protein
MLRQKGLYFKSNVWQSSYCRNVKFGSPTKSRISKSRTLKIPTYSKSRHTQNPDILKIPNAQNPDILKIPTYSKSRHTQNPDILKIPTYSKSRHTQNTAKTQNPERAKICKDGEIDRMCIWYLLKMISWIIISSSPDIDQNIILLK